MVTNVTQNYGNEGAVAGVDIECVCRPVKQGRVARLSALHLKTRFRYIYTHTHTGSRLLTVPHSSASNPLQHMQIKSELRAPFTSHKRQTEWKREGTGEHGRKGGWVGRQFRELSVREDWMLVVAAAGERSLNRRINEQRCSPFIYFPALATWDPLEPFLLLFRGSQRCRVHTQEEQTERRAVDWPSPLLRPWF